MKIERTEKEIRLIPESDFDKRCILDIIENGIRKIHFQDEEWKTGPLIIELDEKW